MLVRHILYKDSSHFLFLTLSFSTLQQPAPRIRCDKAHSTTLEHTAKLKHQNYQDPTRVFPHLLDMAYPHVKLEEGPPKTQQPPAPPPTEIPPLLTITPSTEVHPARGNVAVHPATGTTGTPSNSSTSPTEALTRPANDAVVPSQNVGQTQNPGRGLQEHLRQILFEVEAGLATASLHIGQIPLTRQPLIELMGGSTFDPNPPHARYPQEVIADLRSISRHIRDVIAKVNDEICDDALRPCDISRRMAASAMLQPGDHSHAIKIGLQYQLALSDDPTMAPLPSTMGPLPDDHGVDSQVLDNSQLPHGVAAPDINVESWAGSNTTPIKQSPQDRAQPAKIKKEKALSKPQKAPEEVAFASQKYRMNNHCTHLLEASELDMLRAAQTVTCANAYNSHGVFLPKDATLYRDADENTRLQGMAKFCSSDHPQLPWIVVVSGDVGNCPMCNHQRFVELDMFLRPGTKLFILKRGYGVDTDNVVCKYNKQTKELEPVPQPCHLNAAVVECDRAIWEEGKEFVRMMQLMPNANMENVAAGKGPQKYREAASKKNPDLWLQRGAGNKIKCSPEFKGRTLVNEKSVGRGLKSLDEMMTDDAQLAQFHENRLRKFWDLDCYEDKVVKKAIKGMIAKVRDYEADEKVRLKFNLYKDWFTRDDLVDYLHSKTMNSLLVAITGYGDATIKASIHSKSSKYVLVPESALEAQQPQPSQKRKVAAATLALPTKRPRVRKSKQKTVSMDDDEEKGNSIQSDGMAELEEATSNEPDKKDEYEL
jgi:hypothetical protein